MANNVFDYSWRCTCGTENHPTCICCYACAKRRWSQLGISHWAMLELLARVLPGHIFDRIAA